VSSSPAQGVISTNSEPLQRGVWLYPGVGATALAEAVVAAEELGLDEVWVADEGVARDPLVVLAAAAALTSRIRLAVGITSPLLRHPAAISAAAATLDELSDGRAVLGLGVGGHQALGPLGMTADRPVKVLADAIEWARTVLGQPHRDGLDTTNRLTTPDLGSPDTTASLPAPDLGDPDTTASLVTSDAEAADARTDNDASCDRAGWNRPDHAIAPRSVPIWVGARGPQLVRLAARKADGVFVSGCTRAQHRRIFSDVQEVDATTSGVTAVALYQSVSDRDQRSSVCGWNEAISVLKAETAQLAPASVGINLVDLAEPGSDPVALVGFGTFSVKNRAARSGRNPQTGATIQIEAARVPASKPGKAPKDAVN